MTQEESLGSISSVVEDGVAAATSTVTDDRKGAERETSRNDHRSDRRNAVLLLRTGNTGKQQRGLLTSVAVVCLEWLLVRHAGGKGGGELQLICFLLFVVVVVVGFMMLLTNY